MKNFLVIFCMVFSAYAPAASDRSSARPAKCRSQWMMQASLSPLLSALSDPTLIECGKPKEKLTANSDSSALENRVRPSEEIRGAGPKND